MMDEIKLVDVKKNIFEANENDAQLIRGLLKKHHVFMINLMASPGAGKTSVILQILNRLEKNLKMAVIEGDIESTVDSEKVQHAGFKAVQIRTGGACHLDAAMVSAGLKNLDLDKLDLVFVENIGNLICPAEFDIGADLQMMILSVPEGDDKILKYPIMFSVCDALIVNKIDYLDLTNFDLNLLKRRAHELNQRSSIFEVSCKTGDGLDALAQWIYSIILEKVKLGS